MIIFCDRILCFYRNCYEKAIKSDEDKILKFLSCECICAYVGIINDLYQPILLTDSTESARPMYKLTKRKHQLIETNADALKEKSLLVHAENFFKRFCEWLNELTIKKNGQTNEHLDLDLEIKRFCLHTMDLEISSELRFLTTKPNVFYATVYFSLHKCLTDGEEFFSVEDNLDYFKSKILAYDTSLNSKSEEFDDLNRW